MTFPVLTQQELVRAFADEYLEIKLRDDDFTNPHRQRLQPIYMTCLSWMSDIPLDLLHSNFFNAIKDVEHLEVHNEGLSMLLLTKALQKKLEKAAFLNFSTRDITHPSGKRLSTILSAILNYLRYKVGCDEEFGKINSKIEDRRKHYDSLKKENDELISRINAIRATQAQQQPKITKAREETEKSKKRLAELRMHINALQVTDSQVKTKTAELTSALAKYSDEIALSKKEIERLGSLILHSPERAAQERAIMEEKLEQMKASKQDKLQRLADMRAARSLHRSVEAERALGLIKGIYKMEDGESEAVKELKGLQNKHQQLHAEFVDLDAKKQSLHRTVVTRQEKLDKFMCHHHVKENGLQSQFHSLQKDVENLHLKDDRVRTLEDERQEVLKNIDALDQEFAERRAVLDSDHEMLLNAFNKYNKKLSEWFNEAMTNCKLPDLGNNTDL